jgi:transcriptional repressor p66
VPPKLDSNGVLLQELSKEELVEKERLIRKLREELRNEEMKLVLLKKLKQSQQMKENIAVMAPVTQQPQQPPVTKLTPSVTVSAKLPPPTVQQPPQQVPQALVRGSKQSSAPSPLPPAHRGVSLFTKEYPCALLIFSMIGHEK